MKLYPVLINLEGKRIVVFGGGQVALRKIDDLLRCGARITVISPEIDEGIEDLRKASGESIEIIQRKYREGDMDEAVMVFSAVSDKDTAGRILNEAEKKGILINAAENPDRCSFHIPSWSDKDDFLIAVSTGGSSPAYAARLRREIDAIIPDNIGEVLSALKEARTLLKGPDFSSLTSQERGDILKKIAGNDDLLKELINCSNNNTCQHFLKKIIR